MPRRTYWARIALDDCELGKEWYAVAAVVEHGYGWLKQALESVGSLAVNEGAVYGTVHLHHLHPSGCCKCGCSVDQVQEHGGQIPSKKLPKLIKFDYEIHHHKFIHKITYCLICLNRNLCATVRLVLHQESNLPLNNNTKKNELINELK